ncbi:hypothetical protein [Chamaesiphon sp. VAR_69_metabat_338]|uniref:hypothetical protein n=1 Tax=Chamaesiphon sp. VAR_69_metabat_338 TaxID=2964704 RepID=UPI00286E9CC6|nr:hypothetical protein [Chamaesiphon sp. VAR_69_metabat_338]
MREIPHSLDDNSIDFQDDIDKPIRISARELHKYVWGLVGVLLLAIVTYPIAMSRVSQKENFAPYQSHLKSLTLEYKPVAPNPK